MADPVRGRRLGARIFAVCALVAGFLFPALVLLGIVGAVRGSDAIALFGLRGTVVAVGLGLVAALLSARVRCERCGAVLYGIAAQRNPRDRHGGKRGLVRMARTGQALCIHCAAEEASTRRRGEPPTPRWR